MVLLLLFYVLCVLLVVFIVVDVVFVAVVNERLTILVLMVNR